MLSPGTGSNAILLQVDSSSCYTMGGVSSMPVNTWTWVNYQNGATGSAVSLSLSQGNHTLLLLGNKGGVEVDRLELLSDAHCIPSGTGDNCVTAASTSPSPTPTPSGSTSTNNQGGASANDTANIAAVDGAEDIVNAPVTLNPGSTVANDTLVKAEYYLNKKLIATRTSAPFSYQLQSQNFANGTYTLTVKQYYSSGNITTTSQKLVIKNPASFKQFMLTAQKYTPEGVVIVIVLAVGAFFGLRFLRGRRAARQQATMEQAAAMSFDPSQSQYQAPPSPADFAQYSQPQENYPAYTEQPYIDTTTPPSPEQLPAPQPTRQTSSSEHPTSQQHEDLPHLVARTMYQRHHDDTTDQPQ
jgi:hypothetical protein